MKGNIKLSIFILALLFSVQAMAQLSITGTILEESTQKPLDYVQVTVHDFETKKLIGYAYSNQSGVFSIEVPGPAVYELKSHSLSYESITQSIVIADGEKKEIPVTLVLKQKSFDIEGVEVTATRPPLIVKGDTLIYAASAFTDEADQTVEDILRKIPGMEVLASGELKVRGRNVDRVLINGEEVTDAGAALLTRGIDPRLVRDVEVRMNEQDEKLKKSLLDKNGLVVLDIKLKTEVSKKFGRISLGAGYEGKAGAQPAGLLNGFSLGKKANWHIVGEYDRFGHQTINLSDVKNLGREAQAAIFDVPADLIRLRANPEFDNELYGFKEGVGFEQGTFGISGAVDLGKHAKLYVGTYNALDRTNLFNTTRLEILTEEVVQSFSETEDYQSLSSKNKVEYALSFPNFKFRYSANAVFTGDRFNNRQVENDAVSGNYRSDDAERSFYHNIFLEKRLPSGNGLQLNGMYSNSTRDVVRNLAGAGSALAGILPDDTDRNATLTQRAPVSSKRVLLNSFYYVGAKKYSLKFGLRAMHDELEGSKWLEIEGAPFRESPLSAPGTTVRYTQWLPYVEGGFSFGAFNWSSKVGYGFNRYSTFDGGTSTLDLLELKSKLAVDLGDDNLNLSYSRSTSQFPLLQQIIGLDILDARTLGQGGVYALTPQPEEVLRLSYSTWMLEKFGLGIEAAGIAGRSRSGSSFLFDYPPFVTEVYDQLTTEYAIATLKVAKVFEDFPLQIRAEQSIIHSSQQSRLSEEEQFNSIGNIWLSKLTARTTLKDQPFNFSAQAKRTSITFGDDQSESVNSLLITSLTFSPTVYFFDRKVLLTTDARYVNFSAGNGSSVLLADARLTTRTKSLGFEIRAENIFDGKAITTQNLTGAVFEKNERLLFGRFVRATVFITL